MAIQGRRVDHGRALSHRALDVVYPPPLRRLSERLAAGIDPLIAAALAKIPNLPITYFGLTLRRERLAALATVRIAPDYLVDHPPSSELADMDAHCPKDHTPRVGGNVG